MSSPAERNAPRNSRGQGFKGRPHHRRESVSDEWLWGWHAVEAALANPLREPAEKLMATPERAARIEARFGRQPELQRVDNAAIAQVLPNGAVHQGVALKAPLLESADLASFEAKPGAVLLVLDQVTDPQNVGAIMRSAAALGAAGLILQDRHAPKLTGALAKAAAGAVDVVPTARVVNLSRALEELESSGWRAVGLDGAAERTLDAVLDGGPVVLVLGSEGDGLRRLVAEHCDELARIPMPGGFESLNVSAAAAIALYEAARPRR
ncbi:MAG: 23S rRNA (guanosine(2251)-2'-O)-methyltransferase RlmB [Phenylobacterium sp.]|uniref:23S rRNA (guanosine(2251)-2'-O)-methyltransferase RlmB n=1 Tax=Phenylobacterium sp. TaxID=1871053 RepID=UPI002732527E|nr:23S rRNA (guanosine(2251)-2'-O)-methyltransferase RlmB [Phenylobacterium sp.]MDP3174450.1 23S rRNA (guanosine(2251)-2'-O)-methyltransferase RlmB [Phenylobacterium sp.]